jgi:hypothetical protein
MHYTLILPFLLSFKQTRFSLKTKSMTITLARRMADLRSSVVSTECDTAATADILDDYYLTRLLN